MNEEIAISRLEAANDREWSRLSLGGYYLDEDDDREDDE